MRAGLGLFSRDENAMLDGMDTAELTRRAQAAEAKLAEGRELTREEQVWLLAWMLAGMQTRKDRKYGHA
jgi:hypothetical protein